MHLSLFTDGIYPIVMGGMQKHSYYLAKYLARNGVLVDVYHTVDVTSQPLELEQYFTPKEQKNIRFFAIPFPRNHYFPGHYLWESYLYSKRVYEVWRRQPKPDFVYVQGFSGWKLLNAQPEVPTGINFHGVEMFQKAPDLRVKLEHRLLRRAVKWNLRNTSFIFSLGGKLSGIQKKISPNNQIITIPIGITDDWLNTSDFRVNVPRKLVFIGRYERRKGVEELNEVLKKMLSGSAPLFEMHFIGPIPAGKQLKNNKQIHYHGAVRDENTIKQILRDSDVLVCPSWSEGMPTVILEAMASGCAIVATDVGAVVEQVDDSNGLLIPPGNSEALGNALQRVLELPDEELKKMKKASIERIKEKFLWESVAQKNIEKINIIIAG
ncbi:glycosyltransferase family 4 protein [Geofilum sp. OHC36d9]|uniref:glycosyltransferase family 4 protein n=1 Tax=Geofilum sp. OHC36d9 TaxID=3458413 RepID=UPI004034AABF